MNENQNSAPSRGPRRLAPSKGKLAALIVGIVAAALLAGYLILCAVAGGAAFWPHSYVLGVDVSGLTAQEAADKVTLEAPAQWKGKAVSLVEAKSGATASLDAEGLVEFSDLEAQLAQMGPSGSFFTKGARYLASVFSASNGWNLVADVDFTDDGKTRFERAISSLTEQAGAKENGTTYEVQGENLVFTKGVTGVGIDAEAARKGVLLALSGTGPADVELALTETPPPEPDFEHIHTAVYTAPANATLDKSTKEIVPAVVGMDFDVTAAKAALDAVGEGATCSVPLTLTQPEISTAQLKADLYRDVLGSATTVFKGTDDRRKNIKNAASFINGSILLPGEVFSYNAHCEPYTTSNGYGKASAYVDGASVDTTAGGICQLSSTSYWATLRANLEIVERRNHSYFSDYIAAGLDATVFGGGQDYKFKNNTDYPVKVEAYMNGNNVTVNLYGTNVTGIHGEPYSANKTITNYATTVYKPKADVPRGTTQKDKTNYAYNGGTAEAYLKILDANDNVLETKFLHKDTYSKRDAVVFYNPEDGSPDDPNRPAAATPTPSAAPTASQAPATGAPSQASATGTPASQAPATQAPTSQAPATQAPATQAPASQAPATQPTPAPATPAPAAPSASIDPDEPVPPPGA